MGDRNAGRGSQMIGRIKKKSERRERERDSGSEARSSESATGGPSYERAQEFRARSSYEKPYKPPQGRRHYTEVTEPPGLPKDPVSEPEKVGRGQFLKALANQSKLKSSTQSEEPKIFLPSYPERPKEYCELPNVSQMNVSDAQEPSAPVVRLGGTGEKVNMHCNYVMLTTTPGKGIFEYDVKFEPAVENVKFRYKLIHDNIPLVKGGKCYDGMHKLYLPNAATKEFVIKAKNPQDQTPITVVATYKRQVKLSECNSFYNILLNNCAKALNLTRLGRHHYDSKANLFIPQHKLEVWPGYVTSVEEFEGGLHLCCDIKHRILRTDTAYDVISQIIKTDQKNFKTKAVKELLGQCILTRYNNHLYRIDDIDWNQNPLSTFSAKGKLISYADYYKNQYNITIKDLRQPLLINKPKKSGDDTQICLIPELTHMTGLTEVMRKDMKVMKEVAIYTRITPSDRESALKNFIENINSNSHAQELLNNWGLKINPEPLSLQGRVLPAEGIIFKNEKVGQSECADWLKLLRNQGVLRAVDIVNWIMVHTGRDRRLAESFARAIQQVGSTLGIQICEPQMITLRDDRIESYIKGVKENVGPRTQIVLCLCGTPREDRYSAIKKLCCLEIPVPSQIVNCGTISRESKLRMVAQNVVLQMNNKLGGASWAVNIPLKNSMICGIDTYHDSDKGKSAGALVASTDSKYTKWFSQACLQEPGQELLHGLNICFSAALSKYHAENKKLPDRIIIFRDGVGDGHLEITKNVEIKQFLEACHLIKDYKPKFTYVIVQKRINTKFYMDRNKTLGNPSPGSIMDHTITRRNYYDFFLVSQRVTCGTATPSHYIVLYDNSDFKPDHMQRLTYKFCHLYYNWTGTIRVPAPCQYAHKLAFLVGQNVKKAFDNSLKDKLFYL